MPNIYADSFNQAELMCGKVIDHCRINSIDEITFNMCIDSFTFLN